MRGVDYLKSYSVAKSHDSDSLFVMHFQGSILKNVKLTRSWNIIKVNRKQLIRGEFNECFWCSTYVYYTRNAIRMSVGNRRRSLDNLRTFMKRTGLVSTVRS